MGVTTSPTTRRIQSFAGLLTAGTSAFTFAGGWAKLPKELKDRIIVHAMTAEEDEIRLHTNSDQNA